MTNPPRTLFGVAELCARWGISKQGLAKRREHDAFPDPTEDLAMGPVWTLAQVEDVEAVTGWAPVEGGP